MNKDSANLEHADSSYKSQVLSQWAQKRYHALILLTFEVSAKHHRWSLLLPFVDELFRHFAFCRHQRLTIESEITSRWKWLVNKTQLKHPFTISGCGFGSLFRVWVRLRLKSLNSGSVTCKFIIFRVRLRNLGLYGAGPRPETGLYLWSELWTKGSWNKELTSRKFTALQDATTTRSRKIRTCRLVRTIVIVFS